MGRVDSMKALGREIKGSSDERAAALSCMRKEVADDTIERQREHREMGTQLREDLSKIMPPVRQEVSGLRKSYRNMITGIKKEHKEVVNAWHDLVLHGPRGDSEGMRVPTTPFSGTGFQPVMTGRCLSHQIL